MDFISIGNRIKELRKSKGLTQKELSELSSLTEKYLSNIETGKDNCSLAALLSIANSLEASIDYILSDELLYNRISINKNDESIVNICHELSTMSEKQREYIRTMIINMKNMGID